MMRSLFLAAASLCASLGCQRCKTAGHAAPPPSGAAGSMTGAAGTGASGAAGTATAPSDFTKTLTKTITIKAGMVQQTVPIAVHPDSAAEPDETVTVTITSATGATITHGTGTLTIVNDD